MFKNILGITLMLCVFSLSAYAKKQVRIPVSGSAYFTCEVEGGEIRESANYMACCTGPTECIVCEKGGERSCQLVSISKVNSLGLIKRKAPTSGGNFNAPSPTPSNLRDQIKRSQPTTSAPVKVVSPVKTPTVKPIKQYQQIKTPTKAVQTR